MNITDPIYADEDKAREHLESRFSTGCHGASDRFLLPVLASILVLIGLRLITS